MMRLYGSCLKAWSVEQRKQNYMKSATSNSKSVTSLISTDPSMEDVMNLPRGGEGIVISAGGDDQLTQSQQYYHQSSRNPVVSAPKDPSTKKRDPETTKTKVVPLRNCYVRFHISIRSHVRLSVG